MPYMMEPAEEPVIINNVQVYQGKNYDMNHLVTASKIKVINKNVNVVTKENGFLDTDNKAVEHKIEQFVDELEKSARTIVYFNTNTATLNSKDLKKLEELASYGSVQVKGYADPRGTVQYNKHLSKDRSMYVADWLSQRGIAVDKIEYFGEDKPISVWTNEYNLDRRVEVELKIK